MPKKDYIPARKAEPISTQETRNYYPSDQRLRSFGFRIFARPKSGKDIWVLGQTFHFPGVPYTVEEALQWIEDKIKAVDSALTVGPAVA